MVTIITETIAVGNEFVVRTMTSDGKLVWTTVVDLNTMLDMSISPFEYDDEDAVTMYRFHLSSSHLYDCFQDKIRIPS